MSKKTLYLNVHALQGLPPSCPNRDDVGMPKTCTYGGTLRARVSSQSWKHAMRLWNTEHGIEQGIRSRSFVARLSQELTDRHVENANELAEKALQLIGVVKEKDPKKNAIAFMSDSQFENIVNAIIDNLESLIAAIKDSKKGKKGKKGSDDSDDTNGSDDSNDSNDSKNNKNSKIKKVLENCLKNGYTSDILLFGRMYADNPSLNVDAAAQVAHAISTHEIRVQHDYFTAVEDFKEGDSGAGHIDSKAYSSSTLYRYASVNLSDGSELMEFDRSHAAKVAADFVKAFVLSMPTGSVNSFANRTLPFFVQVEIRSDMPVNYVEAFEKAVKKSADGYNDASIEALKAYEKEVADMYGAPEKSFIAPEQMNFKQLVEEVEKYLGEILDERTGD